ncbi:hypothetical protein ABIE67_009908 [Streptomyces sp. V4I8]|uniref:IS110 family transposase n=1 Tax=Streptomyces sp. V4I8 TaxID=3156469 RepID=UPI003512446D
MNGRVASDDHLSRLAADTRADFLNGESGHAQTPDTCPEGTSDNVRPLVSVGAHGRAYVTGGDARLNIESADGRARFTLHTVPDDAHQEARDGFHKRARELSGQIVKPADGRPVFKPAKVQMWSGKPTPRKAFEPKDYAPGSTPTLLEVPGCGVIGAAAILGETAGAARFKSKDAFAHFNGTAPIPVWSSNKVRVRLNRGGNRAINNALHMIAVTAVELAVAGGDLTFRDRCGMPEG